MSGASASQRGEPVRSVAPSQRAMRSGSGFSRSNVLSQPSTQAEVALRRKSPPAASTNVSSMVAFTKPGAPSPQNSSYVEQV